MTSKLLKELTHQYTFEKWEFARLLKEVNEIKEKWVDIVGYEGLYKLSNFGSIISCGYERKSTRPGDNRMRIKKEVLMTPRKGGGGYRFITLCNDVGKSHNYIHRLVAIHFLKNPENKPEVNHKYGNKANNHIWNLEWATSAENKKHSHRIGLTPSQKGKTTSQSGMIFQFSLEGNFMNVFLSLTIAGERTGIDRGLIWQCVNGYQKTAAGFIWRQ